MKYPCWCEDQAKNFRHFYCLSAHQMDDLTKSLRDLSRNIVMLHQFRGWSWFSNIVVGTNCISFKCINSTLLFSELKSIPCIEGFVVVCTDNDLVAGKSCVQKRECYSILDFQK